MIVPWIPKVTVKWCRRIKRIQKDSKGLTPFWRRNHFTLKASCIRAAWPAHIRVPHSSGKAVIFTVASNICNRSLVLIEPSNSKQKAGSHQVPVLMSTTCIGLGLVDGFTLPQQWARKHFYSESLELSDVSFWLCSYIHTNCISYGKNVGPSASSAWQSSSPAPGF